MTPHLWTCYTNSLLSHYTWREIAQTLCDVPRPRMTSFATSPAECVVCVAIALAILPGTNINGQYRIALRIRGVDC